MKTKIIFLVLLFSAQILAAQDSLKKKWSYAVVKLIASEHIVTGHLEAVGDSAIVMSVPIRGLEIDTASLLTIPVDRILSVKLRKGKRSVGAGIGRGVLIGGGAGALFGLTIMAATPAPQPGDWQIVTPEAVAFSVGIIGLLTGVIIGAIAPGNTHVTIPVEGNFDQYNQYREELKSHARRSHTSPAP